MIWQVFNDYRKAGKLLEPSRVHSSEWKR